MTLSNLATNRLLPQRVTANADFSNTATGTYSSSGVNYKYVTFTASSTLTIGTAGVLDFLVVGGGGSGSGPNSGGGGGGGGFLTGTIYVSAGSYTMTVGAGGAGPGTGGSGYLPGNIGGYSQANFSLAPITAYGGDGGGPKTGSGAIGSGGGGNGGQSAGQPGVGQNGNAGGTGAGSTGGAGAGGGGAGSAGSQTQPVGTGSGGNGLASSIAGSTPATTYTAGSYTFSGGGRGISGVASGLGSQPNYGGASDASNSGPANGASGIIIIRVRTN